MHAERLGAVRRSAVLAGLAAAAVCATAGRAHSQPLYEQQPGPGDQPQAQPQAPAYQQQPAPEYAQPTPYQPPADYVPPPNESAATQQPAYYNAPPPVPPDRQRGFLIMPFGGGKALMGGPGTAMGFGFGGIAGLRFGDINGGHGSGYMFSTNSEIALDFANRSSSTGSSSYNVHMIFAASPFLHLMLSGLPNTEFIVGPKLGYWVSVGKGNSTDYYGDTVSVTQTYVGYVLGLNLGAFYGMGDTVALGGMVSFDFRLPTACSLGSSSSSSSSSSSTCPAGSSLEVLSLNAAALF